MSNPTIATKLTSFIKGIFGRKDPVVTTVPEQPEKKDEAPASETTAQESAEVETTPEASPEQEKPTEEKTEAEEKPEPVTEASAPTETPAPEKDSTGTTEAPEAAKLVEEPREEPSAPATADLAEDGSALAEELNAAEAHTTVASDEVLEKVRKGNAPAVEDLAVPTYDELTLPSIRARLRKLTIEQVRDLRAYEVAHQGRPEFIKMYDNRIAKLEAETGA